MRRVVVNKRDCLLPLRRLAALNRQLTSAPTQRFAQQHLSKVLVANRGEIAVRIARAAASLGIETVAVFQACDAHSLHVSVCDQAVQLPGEPLQAYLDIDNIVEAAKSSGCDSVHPGYGFLSESASFAAAVGAAGMTFVGPSAEALALFGDKVSARALAQRCGVPIIPGSNALESPEAAVAEARRIGCPVVLKASHGGGGRGMRVCGHLGEVATAFEQCMSEARAFGEAGEGGVFVERAVVRPRHIEVQVLADADGNVVHCFERDCSVQLRHQKVVEIAPAPALDAELREQLFSDALKLARASGYVNAGTVEFLLEPESGRYYFCEVNPRIQVEHTVTEEVTGIDLVESQLRVAGGSTLAELGLPSQDAVPLPRGFAIQARVVALGGGCFELYKEPCGRGVRVDSCGFAGYSPPPHYDPLFAKLIVSSRSPAATFESVARDAALRLSEFHVSGVPTNLRRLGAILRHPHFLAADARTTLVAELGHDEAGAGSASQPTCRHSYALN